MGTVNAVDSIVYRFTNCLEHTILNHYITLARNKFSHVLPLRLYFEYFFNFIKFKAFTISGDKRKTNTKYNYV